MDLNHPASDEVIKDLVAKVDVVVENYGRCCALAAYTNRLTVIWRC